VQRIRNPLLKQRIVAAYDNEKYINGTGLSNILLKQQEIQAVSLKTILAIINSKAVNFWFSHFYHDVNIKPEQLRNIPIPSISLAAEKTLSNFIDQILLAKKLDVDSDTSALEREIDELVYALYGLTPDEIALIEAAH
jgi:hypothetical protein